MPNIAIIDDRPEQSKTLQLNIQAELEEMDSALGVITSLPFMKIDAYFSYVDSMDICLLILDERLNDQPISQFGAVGYRGSELVVELRKRLKYFPIFTVTAISDDSDLLSKQSLYEQIIPRKKYYDNPTEYVPRFVRAAKSYLTDHLNDLNQFNELTKKIATGDENADLRAKLNALQVKLQLPLANFDDRNGWLNEYEKQISELKKLNDKIKTKLRKKK